MKRWDTPLTPDGVAAAIVELVRSREAQPIAIAVTAHGSEPLA